MAKDLYSRYIWLIDTIRRYGGITRRELDECWRKSQFSQGTALPRRTFFNYRQAIEEIFGIAIEYDSHAGTYFIPQDNIQNNVMADWMLNSASITDILADSRDVASQVFLENVPSARHYLPDIIAAMRQHHQIVIDYHPYTRSTSTKNIVLDPYFLKIFRQRWYITGYNHADEAIKTYALDRITSLRLTTTPYRIPKSFVPEDYFRYSFGIIFNQGEVKDIVIKTDIRQAKYFRALPLHNTQVEEFSDSYSIFTYKMRISDDLVSELLSYGPKITVLRPPELRAIITSRLRQTLDNYESDTEVLEPDL